MKKLFISITTIILIATNGVGAIKANSPTGPNAP